MARRRVHAVYGTVVALVASASLGVSWAGDDPPAPVGHATADDLVGTASTTTTATTSSRIVVDLGLTHDLDERDVLVEHGQYPIAQARVEVDP